MKPISLILILLLFSGSIGARKVSKKKFILDEINIVINRSQIVPQSVLHDLEYFIKYVDTYNRLPKKYMSKATACRLNWSSKYCGSPPGVCNLKQVARGKKIGGDRFRASQKWPKDEYRELDLGELLPNQCRNKYRLIYAKKFDKLYFSDNHYQSFIRLR